ncbi:HAD family hydrolase [Thermasporomyces composti]|nr:HAD hydrolase family protein [Thermasporomyces composti]
MVALDIDGTLIDLQGRISPAVERAARRVVESGAHVVLATGRGLTATRPVAEQFDLPKPYLVCSNGAVVVRLHPEAGSLASEGRSDGPVDDRGVEVIDLVTFDPAPVLRMLLARLPEALVAVEELGVGYRVNAPFPPGELTGRISIEPLENLVNDPATRVILREPSIEAEHFLDVIDRVGLHGVSYYIGYTAWLDLAPEGVSKATGLAKVAERLGIRREDVLAIGDGSNDLEMLSWAGRGVAMGNAASEVKDVADDVTASVDDDGVALELSRWFDDVDRP